MHFEFAYRKIPKISPWAYIFQRPCLRGLSTEGNLRFKIDWASLRSKFTVFALFYFVFEGNFQVQAPRGGGGGLYLEGRSNRGFFCVTSLGGLFSEFYGISISLFFVFFCGGGGGGGVESSRSGPKSE